MQTVKLAQRFVCPLARLRDNQRLGRGCLQPSRMASCFTQRAGERETGMAGFIVSGGIFAMPVRANYPWGAASCRIPKAVLLTENPKAAIVSIGRTI